MTESFDDASEEHGLPNPLPLPVPPNLAETFGYPGDARFVAFSHEPYGDETYYHDGRLSGTGNWHAFKLYREHPAVAQHLNAFALGSSDEESTHAVVVDREEHQATVLPWVEARRFLQSQPPESRESPAAGAMGQEDVLQAMQDILQTPRSLTPDDIMRLMSEQHEAETALRAWLDQHLPPTE